MPVNNRSKITSFALKSLTGAVASAVFLSSSAYAAGLGKLTVLSALGQPLNAEIELTAVSADEGSSLVAKLAPADAFRLANIEFNPALLALRFNVEQRGTRQFVKITSASPVNEPFVDMLLELSWSTGRLVREYTFLLDPAEMRTANSAQVAAPVDVLSQGNRTNAQPARPAPTPRPAASTPAAPAAQQQAAQPAAAPAPSAATVPSGNASEYKVQKGDSLGKIAARLKPVEVSLDMMLVALYRANPDAFSGNNMNRLKSGQILAVPDTAAIKGTGDGEARGVVVAHAADFNAYRAKLAGQVSTAAPDKAPEASQSTGGKITAQVAERPTAANVAKDQLKLSKAAQPTEGKSAAVSTEEKIAKEKALAEATARVKELERNVSELEKLMAVKSKAGTEAQKPAPVVVPPPAAKPAVVVPAPVPAPAVAVKPSAAVVAKPAVVVPPPAKPAVPPPATAAKKTPPPPATPASTEPGFMDMVMENIMMILGGIGALILVFAGLAMARRKKASKGNAAEPSILGAPTDQAHSLFAETGGQSVDTSNSVFNSSFAPSASQLDTNEVDPVAEADVYIAYGRDAQAEEILKEALRTHPERYPVRLKLLEIYAARKDLRAFEGQASELYSMTKGMGDEWAQAAALGLAIDPPNPLYAGAPSAAPAPAAASEEAAILNEQLEESIISSMPEEARNMDLSADATAVPAAPKAAEDHTLDFDLGGLSFEPVKADAPAAPPADLAPSTQPMMDMDFAAPAAAAPISLSKGDAALDMDFNMDIDKPAATPPAAQHAQALDDISLDLASHDLSAEFAAGDSKDGMGDLASAFDIPAPPSAAPAAPAGNSMDFGDMNFDLPGTPAAAPAAKADDAEDFFAMPDLPGGAPVVPAPAPSFDMSGIDLDLPAGGAETALPDFDVATADNGEGSAVHMEMETKLDLAIAYQEIGDKEGARELLDEVIKGGTAEQVGKANDMRAKLA